MRNSIPASATRPRRAAGGWHTCAMSWKILLSPPHVSEVERDLLLGAFDSGWIAPAGPDLDAFEAELTAFTGAKAVVGLSSGTAAIHLALLAVGVQPGDDVLVSDLTFGASAFAVRYVGARPCFVDCDPVTWHLDPELLAVELARRAATNTLPSAVVAVDLYGSMADLVGIAAACANYDVPLVEDAAEALGAHLGGLAGGRFGRVGVLSFNGNKILTTGGGGALLSDDPALVDRVRHLATQARQAAPHYEHSEIGFNYRMGNLNAAVGRGQLLTLPARIAKRRRVREGYQRRLASLPGVTFQQSPPGCVPNHWLTTISINSHAFGIDPVEVLRRLHSAGIEARPGFKPMHLQPVFADAPVVGGDVAAQHFATSVSLPSGSQLNDDDVEMICDVITADRV